MDVASGRDCVDLVPREELIFVAGIGSLWEPGGALCTIGVPPEGTLSWCDISTLMMDKGSCDHLLDLRNWFDLLWDESENAISSVGDSPGVFPQNWLPPYLSNKGLLEATGFVSCR